MDNLVLVPRKCASKLCKNIFRVTEKSNQQYCSEYCKIQANPRIHPLQKRRMFFSNDMSKCFNNKENRNEKC